MRIETSRGTAFHRRPGRGRAPSAAEGVQDVDGDVRRSVIEGVIQASSKARSTLRPAAAMQTPSLRVIQALDSYVRIAALTAEPGEFLDVYA